MATSTRRQQVAQLRRQLEGRHETGSDTLSRVWSCGSPELDRWLPQGGLRGDAVTEWVADHRGSGAMTMSLIAAASCLKSRRSDGGPRGDGPLVVVSPRVSHRGGGFRGERQSFYPPAATALGIPASRMIWVRPRCAKDLVWAIDQALRCPAVAAVWGWIAHRLDDRDARRFQLAAESGGTPALLVRPPEARHQPSFATVRWHVAQPARATQTPTTSPLETISADRVLQVTLDRCRGAVTGQQMRLRVDDQARVTPLSAASGDRHESSVVHLASELAHPKTAKRSLQRRA